MKNEQISFSTQLKKIMKEKKITQQELADKIGVYQTMVSHWLRGIKNPTLTSLKKIADALEISVSCLIGEETNENNKEKIVLLKNKIEELEKQNKDLQIKVLKLENDNLKFALEKSKNS
ncbi:MAG: helix-turn-helix transcriptional regulator [Elusimicrobia bacterium]|nr:helix-turn-helix transcriptional regulator [Elusimicrobiota bacterium]